MRREMSSLRKGEFVTEIIRKLRIPLTLFSGVLLGLTLLFPKIGALEWVALVPFAAVMYTLVNDKSVRLWKFLLYGGLFSGAFYVTIYYWLLYMHTELEKSNSELGAWALATFMWLGLSFIYTVFGSLAVLAFAAISRTRLVQNIKFLQPFVFASVWSIYEYLQTFGWWGVPWGRLAIGQTEIETMLQSASLFGSYYVTFLLLTVNFLLGYMLMHPERVKVITAVCAVIILGNFSFGAVSILTYKDEGEPVRVGIVQGNMSSVEKWNNRFENTQRIYTGLTREVIDEGAEIVIWPETALPYNIFDNETVSKYVQGLAAEVNTTLLISGFTEGKPYGDAVYEDLEEQLYNSMIEVKPDGSFGEDIYHKIHLVPFGEFVPMRDIIMTLIPPLANVGMLDDDIIAGDESVVMNTEVGRVGNIICFDSIYEKVALDSTRNGAQLLSISTNDSWFRDSRAGYMHMAQAKVRAIECGRYLVRAGNTGISAVITPTGEVKGEYLEPMVSGTICEDVYMRDGMTLYVTIGNAFVYVCAAYLALCIISSVVIFSREKKKTVNEPNN